MGDELKNGSMVKEVEDRHYKELSQTIQREVKKLFHCC